MSLGLLRVCTILVITMSFGLYAYEPMLRCYFCRDCETGYENTAIQCNPHFYFCIFLAHRNGSVDRYCGDYGNCTGLVEAGGNCSMCSADYCNSDFHSGDAVIPNFSLRLYVITLIVNAAT